RGIGEVAGVVVGIVQTSDTPYFLVTGEDPRGFAIARYRLIAGRPLGSRRQVLLGKLTAKNAKKTVGDTFRINDAGYRVAGIYETGASFEDNGAVIALADAQRAFDKHKQVSFFKVQLRDLDRRDEIKSAIEERWDDLAVTRSGEPSKQDEMLNLYRSLGWFLGIFAILVGGLGMMNAMLMSVFERTREIGVLRALGWRRRRIIALILGEALMVSIIGGALGAALGAGLLQVASLSPAVGGFLSGTLDPNVFVQALVTALVLGMVGGAFPAWHASRLAPVEAMRAESGVVVHSGPVTRWLAGVFRGSALRSLWRRPIRTLLTTLGLGIGVGFVIMLIGITEGSRELFTKLLTAGQADLVAEQADASDAAFSQIDERIADQIQLNPEVRAVSKMIFGTSTGEGLSFFIVFGLDPNEEYIQHYRVREGRPIARQREIMLGRLAAESQKKHIGDTMHVAGSSYKLVGIYETGISMEDVGGVLDLRDAQRLFRKPRQVSFIGIGLRDPSRAAEVAAELERQFPEVMVMQPATMTERMQDFVSMNAVFNALVALMVVVGGIVMTNVMVMSVFERTQEIGVLRALGWRRQRLLRMVLVESLALSGLSGLAGIGIGLGLNALVGIEPTYGRLLPTSYTAANIAEIIALVLGLGALGGLYPAWRAANLRPVEALRYE
ncbi:MAG TPA: FtsX-like permease family protein, partial [Roseiflexaceae bacterium]|nr:FtsX-like permease family protein [Roseiflexaceae bacterium]